MGLENFIEGLKEGMGRTFEKFDQWLEKYVKERPFTGFLRSRHFPPNDISPFTSLEYNVREKGVVPPYARGSFVLGGMPGLVPFLNYGRGPRVPPYEAKLCH